MSVLPDGVRNPTIVYSSYLRQKRLSPATAAPIPPAAKMVSEMAPLSQTTAEWLKQGGVRKVVVGHQPIGDVPLYLRAHGIEVMFCRLPTLSCARGAFISTCLRLVK
jgi:hypothetical protein